MRKSTIERRQSVPVEQCNSHGFGDFKLVLLEVVEHVFRIESVAQGERRVVEFFICVRDLGAVGRIGRPGGVSVAVVLESGRFIRS